MIHKVVVDPVEKSFQALIIMVHLTSKGPNFLTVKKPICFGKTFTRCDGVRHRNASKSKLDEIKKTQEWYVAASRQWTFIPSGILSRSGNDDKITCNSHCGPTE